MYRQKVQLITIPHPTYCVFSPSSLQEILEECTSPPKISTYGWNTSPKQYLQDTNSFDGQENTLGNTSDCRYIVLDEISEDSR